MSCRNAVLSAAASSKLSGGTSRVLVRPGAEALAMIAMPQLAAPCGFIVRVRGSVAVMISRANGRAVGRAGSVVETICIVMRCHPRKIAEN
jgi:hypothetical protein